VPPGQVVLGLGFYGRSFQLEDADCSTPGCQFSGPAKAGVCTNSAGTLAYYEIQDIITAESPDIIHDSVAAVNYITFGDNKDQWVSYDDAVTMKQKVDWANSVGLGGVMIWSVDQDDESFSALEGLLGQTLPSFEDNLKRTATADTNHWFVFPSAKTQR
jgi:GH18 family chitinase